MDILPVQLQVSESVRQVASGRLEPGAIFTRCAILESAFQTSHRHVQVLVTFRRDQQRRDQLVQVVQVFKAFHHVAGGLALLDGVLGFVLDSVHVRVLVVDPSLLASDLTSKSA